MKKATRMMEDSLRQVDAVIELRDARIPESSRNPDVARLSGGKPRLIILNRADQADPDVTAQWVRCPICRRVWRVLPMDCRSGRGVGAFPRAARELLEERIRRNETKGQAGKALRFMVLGIPNVGKSSFINRPGPAAVRHKPATGPGVTRGKQWIAVSGGARFWIRRGSSGPGLNLRRWDWRWPGREPSGMISWTWSWWPYVCWSGWKAPTRRPGRAVRLGPDSGPDGFAMLEQAGRRRGFLVSGGQVNTERMARVLLDEFRAGKLGRITLERP